MRTNQLVIRCYAKKDGDSWVAIAVDLSLAAQAETLEEAKEKLESMIHSYIHDAFTVDREYAEQLLNRKAPLSQRMEYAAVSMLGKLLKFKKSCRIFNNVLPMELVHR